MDKLVGGRWSKVEGARSKAERTIPYALYPISYKQQQAMVKSEPIDVKPSPFIFHV